MLVVVVLGRLEESWELFDSESSEDFELVGAVSHGGGGWEQRKE